MRPGIEALPLVLCAVAAFGTGCAERDGNAVLRDYTGLDGCGWVIEANGTVLEPLNLGEFLSDPEDGMDLNVVYHVETGYASICMVGDIVTLTACELAP
ncbi:MAG: hypothetical protein O3B70_07225 [Bacteroidetes bacterium]|nr:hypothetical protein [Bacteroidota bacterium]